MEIGDRGRPCTYTCTLYVHRYVPYLSNKATLDLFYSLFLIITAFCVLVLSECNIDFWLQTCIDIGGNWLEGFNSYCGNKIPKGPNFAMT